MIKPSVVAAANYVPSGENLRHFILTASLTFLFTRFLVDLAPGRSSLVCQASSSKSESSSSISCYITPPSLTFLEFNLCKTPSSDLFWVTANLLSNTLCLRSYKQIFLPFPPPITKSPFGESERLLKCLFFVDLAAVFLSCCSLPPDRSALHSTNDFIWPSSLSQRNICPPSVVEISSFLVVGWNSQWTTSELCSKVSRRPYLPKMSQTLTVMSQLELARIDPDSAIAFGGLKLTEETGA